MGAEAARLRGADLRRPARPQRHRADRRRPRARRRRRAARRGEGAARRVRRAHRRQRRGARGRGAESEDPHGRRRGDRQRHRALQPLGDAAVPDRGRAPHRRGAAPEVPLPRPAAARAGEELHPARPHRLRHPRLHAPPRLSRHRDADPDEVDPRGGPRLPRAEPRAQGAVVRAAAVAADLQATAASGRHGALLPDRPLLPRRGQPQRPAAGVHADRRRGLVH